MAERTVILTAALSAWLLTGSPLWAAPLHDAAKDGDLALVKQLVSEGADVEALSEQGWTPLHEAALAGQYEIVDELLSQGAKVNARIESESERTGWTALHIAAAGGNSDLAILLISHNAKIKAVANVDEKGDGLSPLHMAAKNGDVAMAEVLLSNGADVDAIAPGGWNAFHLAAFGNFVPFAKVLRSNGGSPLDRNPYNQMQVLHVAARSGHQEMVEYLLASGVGLNPRDWMGRTPTQQATIKGHADLAEFLKAKGGIE